MKKAFSMKIILFLTGICLLVSCNKTKQNEVSYIHTENDYYLYDLNEKCNSFDVDDNGNIYYLSYKDRNQTGITDDGIEYVSTIPECILKVLDKDGKLINSYILDNYADRFCLGSNCLYYINANANPNDRTLYAYSYDTQKSHIICDINGYMIIDDLICIDNRIFFLGINNDYIDKDYKLADSEDNFNYNGERIGCVDLATGTFNELDIDFPITYSKTPGGNLMIYAYDEEKGFYFTELDISVMKFTDRVYNNLENIYSFQIINDSNDFLYCKLKSDANFTLAIGNIKHEELDTELIPDYPGDFTSILYLNNYAYSRTADNRHILRVRADYFKRSSEIITMLSPIYYNMRTPFGCGYTIKSQYLTDEEMALTMLSQDEGYDIYYLNSCEDISENIRDKGSFYPLNKVEGVEEYLNKCFSYVKAAATDENGDIWMLPVVISIPYIIYNENTCRDYNIGFHKNLRLDEFVEILAKVKQNSNLENMYKYNVYFIREDLMHQYTREYTDFDNELFRKLAGCIKDNLNDNLNGKFIMFTLTKNQDNSMLFATSDPNLNYDLGYLKKIINTNGLRACGFPGIMQNEPNTAYCYFLCVNPSSKKLKTTLQYISSLCNYLQIKEDNMALSGWDIQTDKRLFYDLYEIYANGDVQFTYPDELYKEDLLKFISGEKELEKVIEDSNHRMNIYLNE